jgi:hypothetical protein
MKFTNTNSAGSKITLEFNADLMSVQEVLQQFTYFLRGCGFTIDSDHYISVEQDD